MLQFDLNISYFNSLEDAEFLVIAVVKNALATTLYTRISNINTDIYNTLINADTPDWFNRAGLPTAWPFTAAEIDALTICQAYKVLIIISRTPKAAPATTACSLLVSSIIALCKKGSSVT